MKVHRGTEHLEDRRLVEIPAIFRGIHVKRTVDSTGTFDVAFNKLENSPSIVDGDFDCGSETVFIYLKHLVT